MLPAGPQICQANCPARKSTRKYSLHPKPHSSFCSQVPGSWLALGLLPMPSAKCPSHNNTSIYIRHGHLIRGPSQRCQQLVAPVLESLADISIAISRLHHLLHLHHVLSPQGHICPVHLLDLDHQFEDLVAADGQVVHSGFDLCDLFIAWYDQGSEKNAKCKKPNGKTPAKPKQQHNRANNTGSQNETGNYQRGRLGSSCSPS